MDKNNINNTAAQDSRRPPVAQATRMTDVRGVTTPTTRTDVQVTDGHPADPLNQQVEGVRVGGKQMTLGLAGAPEEATRTGMEATATKEDLATARVPQVVAADLQTTVILQEETYGANATILLAPGMSLGMTMRTAERRKSLRR